MLEARPRRRLAAATAACLLALVLAGCIGGGGGSGGQASTPETAGAGGPPGPGGPADATRNLTFEKTPADATLEISGSFAATDGAWAGGGLRGADTRTHDLTPEIPAGVPVVLNATVTYPGSYTQINADLVVDGVELYRQHQLKAVDKNTIWLEARLARLGGQGTIQVVVQADTTGPNPELNYSLTANINPRPQGLVPRAPVSAPAPANSGGLVLVPGNGTDTVPPTKVWGPDGSWVGRVGGGSPGPVEVATEGPPGRYALLVEPTGGPGDVPPTVRVRTVNATQAPGALEVVETEIKRGAWHEIAPGGEASWSFNRSAPPAAVGVTVRAAGGTGAAAGFPALEASVTSPKGEVATGSQTGIWLNYRYHWASTVGHPNLVPGTYSVTASQEAGTSAQAAHAVLELKR